MFSPLAFRDGAILYELITHAPPPSHLALSPFDLYREPLVIAAIADGQELNDATFSKRSSSSGTGPTIAERNIRALYQELEDLRDTFPKALVYQTLIFDYENPDGITIPEGIVTVPSEAKSKRTTMKTVMCSISSLLLAELTTLAKSFEAMSSIDSPGHYSAVRHINGSIDGSIVGNPRRNSQFALPQQLMRSSSLSGPTDKAHARMSMPPVPTRSTSNGGMAADSSPGTPMGASHTTGTAGSDAFSSAGSTRPSSPESKLPRSESAHIMRDSSRDRVSMQGFGPGGANDKWRLRGKGRVSIVIGSMYLQAGRWNDAIRELSEGATAARSLNDHIWHGKALELILMSMFLLSWAKVDFTIPQVCMPQERPGSANGSKPESEKKDTSQPSLQSLETILPELLERIINLYSRISSESLPPLAFSETVIRFCKILLALHICDGELNERFLDLIVDGHMITSTLTTSPRLNITPSRQQIVNLLFKAFPSASPEVLSNADRISILSGVVAVLGPLGFQRKKALVLRELVSVLIGGLVEARTKGAAEAGVHPAAGLVSLASTKEAGGAMALDLREGDIEHGIEAFLRLLCRAYGVVGFEDAANSGSKDQEVVKDSDEAVIQRIKAQSALRCFGFSDIKVDILRSCVNFAEALPDFKGVLTFSSDLLRTAGSGVAPGSRREDATPLISREEQARLVTSISRTWGLAQKLGAPDVAAEFWDEFLLRGIALEPLPITRTPIPHAKSVLPGAAASRASQDVNPFIYNPFLKEASEVSTENLVAGELANFRVTLQNTYEVELEIESIEIEATGIQFEAIAASTVIGPYRTQVLILKGRPLEAGDVKITGAVIKVRGCRERRFPIFSKAWTLSRADKVKCKGATSVPDILANQKTLGRQLETDTLSLKVVSPQPILVVKSTSLRQSTVMVLEGERQIFTVTLQNMSKTPVDFMLFSFKDSTQKAIQTALSNYDTTPAELYEYELILMKKQALRLPRSDQNRNIGAGEEATFEFEILGKAGLTSAAIQVDYTYLGVPPEELKDKFYTRQVSMEVAVTVNASIDMTRIDLLPLHGDLPTSLWDRVGGHGQAKADEYCLLSMDLRNSWPTQISIKLEGDDGMSVGENILPGKTSRIMLPLKRIYLADPHAAIPSLNPSRNRQFVVSTSKISPSMERSNREAFWYRERILDSLKATWSTTSAPKKTGALDLRSIRLSPRMIDVVKINDMDISISVVSDKNETKASNHDIAYVDEFIKIKVDVYNRTAQPIVPLVRLMPALCHRPLTVALEYTRKFAWNGTLQQLLPAIAGQSSGEFVIGVTVLCRGQFELTASVEEVVLADDDRAAKEKQARHRSGSQMGEALVGMKERRTWHSREPFLLTVQDRE